MSYDPSAKYSRNDLMRLAKVFGVHTTRGAPGDRARNMRPRSTANLRAAIAAKGSPLPGRSLATSFEPSDLMQYTMYNLRYFAKQMKVPATYRGRTKTKAELLKGLTLAAKGVMVPGVSTRKGTRSAASSPRRPSSGSRRPKSAPAGAKSPVRRARLTRNVGASAKSSVVLNGTAMRSLFAETPVAARRPRTARAAPKAPKIAASPTPVTMTTPSPVRRARLTRNVGASPKSKQVVNRSAMRSLFAESATPTLTPSRLMSPTPELVSPTPPLNLKRTNSASALSALNTVVRSMPATRPPGMSVNAIRAAASSRGAARRSARIARMQQAAVAAAKAIPKGKQ